MISYSTGTQPAVIGKSVIAVLFGLLIAVFFTMEIKGQTSQDKTPPSGEGNKQMPQKSKRMKPLLNSAATGFIILNSMGDTLFHIDDTGSTSVLMVEDAMNMGNTPNSAKITLLEFSEESDVTIGATDAGMILRIPEEAGGKQGSGSMKRVPRSVVIEGQRGDEGDPVFTQLMRVTEDGDFKMGIDNAVEADGSGVIITLESLVPSPSTGKSSVPRSVVIESTSGETFMTVENDGDMGIGVVSPSEKLHIGGTAGVDGIMFPDGTFQTTAFTGGMLPSTDASKRGKANIQTFESGLETVQQLRGVSYTRETDGKPGIGLIAEEVGEVIPEIVKYEENGVAAKSIDYSRLVAVLIEAVKEQQNTIRNLTQENASVQSQLIETKAALNAINEKLAEIESRLETP